MESGRAVVESLGAVVGGGASRRGREPEGRERGAVVGGGASRRGRERAGSRGQSRMNTDLSSVKLSSDLSPSSRPMPDCLYPPNGKVESSSE